MTPISHMADMHREYMCRKAASFKTAVEGKVYADSSTTRSAVQAYFNYRMLVAWLFRGVVHALVNFFVAVVFLGGL